MRDRAFGVFSRSLIAASGAVLAILHASSPADAALVIFTQTATWTATAGGNDHIYEAVLFDSVVSWTDARDAALARGGHLATITSAAENAFIFDNLASNPALWDSSPTPMADGPYLGGFRAAGAPGGSGDSWQWVTGEAWNHTAWAPGEPNNNPNDLQGLAYWSLQGPASTWFDHTASDPVSRALIVEYPVPAPAAAAFVLLCGIMPRRRMR